MRFSTEVLTRMRQLAGEDFIIGMAISVDITRPDVLSIADQQEILAWHDARGLYDYVTCGTGSYFDFTKIIPPFVYEDKLGAPFAEALKQVAKHVRVQAESHIRTPENADYVIASGQADMVSDRARPDRRSPSRQQGAGGARRATSAPASPATRCAGAAARATTGSPAWSIPRRGASSNGAATRFTPARKRQARAGGGRRARRARGGAGRRRARPSGDAGRGLRQAGRPVPPGRHAAAPRPRSSICCNGMRASSRSCRSRVMLNTPDGCRRDPGLRRRRGGDRHRLQPGGHRLPARHAASVDEPARRRRGRMSIRSRR